MDNYKIKVKDEAESKEAQELFFELGYAKSKQCQWLVASCIQFFATDGEYLHCWDEEKFGGNRFESLPHKELTLPQLRDLVVLKRNDVKDANVEDGTGFPLYLSSTNELYVNDCEWKLSKKNGDLDYICKLKLIHRPQDPALISGADAMIAALDGKHVVWQWADGCGNWQEFNYEEWTVEDLKSDRYNFKIMPQTIKLELELPKPFEPKLGDIYWFISPFYSTGYDHCTFTNDSADKLHVQYGAYRSEDDVKKAVEQLRKIRGAS